METRLIALSELHPNNGQLADRGLPKNPRFIRDAKFKKLVQSIKDDPEMLELREILAYDSGDEKIGLVIIGGNMRYQAMKQLGMKDAPTKVLPPEFPMEKLRRVVLKDNSSFGETDFEALINEWTPEDIDAAAIDIPDIQDPVAEEAEEAKEDNFDIDENTPKVAKSRLGDIYQLGDHRLICGDSTKVEYLDALMDGAQADLLLTDPPYNVGYESKNQVLNAGKGGGNTKIENDNMDEAKFVDFLTGAFKTANEHMKAGAAFYIWYAGGKPGLAFRKACRNVAWEIRQLLVWNKNSFVLGRQDYQSKHEPCLYGWKDGASHYFVDKRNLTTVLEEKLSNIDELSKAELKEILSKFMVVGNALPTTVIDCDKPQRNDDHPTMKPVPLFGQLIINSTRRKDIVLDIFGGSGTTLIACEQLGRKARLVEFEPIYADVIVKRWEELTGKKAKLLGNILDKEGGMREQEPQTEDEENPF